MDEGPFCRSGLVSAAHACLQSVWEPDAMELDIRKQAETPADAADGSRQEQAAVRAPGRLSAALAGCSLPFGMSRVQEEGCVSR